MRLLMISCSSRAKSVSSAMSCSVAPRGCSAQSANFNHLARLSDRGPSVLASSSAWFLPRSGWMSMLKRECCMTDRSLALPTTMPYPLRTFDPVHLVLPLSNSQSLSISSKASSKAAPQACAGVAVKLEVQCFLYPQVVRLVQSTANPENRSLDSGMNVNEAHPKREFGKPDQSSPTKALVFAAKCGVTGVSSCGPGNIPPAMTRRRGNPNWGRPAPEPTPDYAVAKNLNLVVADDAHLVLLEVCLQQLYG